MALTWAGIIVGGVFVGVLLSAVLFLLIWIGGSPIRRALRDGFKIGMGLAATMLIGLFILGVFETWAR